MGIIFKDDRYTRGNHCAQSKMNFVFYYRDMKLTEKKYYRSVVDCFCPICFYYELPDKKCNPRGYKHVVPQMFNIRNMTTHVISQIKYVQHAFKLCDWLNRSDVPRFIS